MNPVARTRHILPALSLLAILAGAGLITPVFAYPSDGGPANDGAQGPVGAAPSQQVVAHVTAGGSRLQIIAGAGLRVPILMYHYIQSNVRLRDVYGQDLSVTPAHFAAQIAFLAAHGFTPITLDDLIAALRDGAPLPAQPIVLTFDDGYADFYTAAYPVLEEYGFKATSFIITGRVGTPGFLTWDEMRAMQAGGLVQFGAHTVDHVEVNHIPLTRAQYELAASRQALETHLNTRVDTFSYPSGQYDAAVEALLVQDGYRAAVTTAPGLWHTAGSLLTLTRVRIHGGDSLASFAAHLGLGTAATPVATTARRAAAGWRALRAVAPRAPPVSRPAQHGTRGRLSQPARPLLLPR